ncbi:MAG TPA: D-aminoacylase [Cyclobacteriaceae bacterium]|nr:D-aminoacylase [Cyclobacteriaceae bacterium]
MKITFLALVLLVALATNAQQYDVLIKNGKIIDGSGNSWFYGDVAISNGKIVAVGRLTGTATKTIDAKGLIVAPGFIDVHTHIEGDDLRVPTAANFIYDGVTSVVTGNCGSSNTDIGKYFRQLDSVKTSINVATLVGHNDVRERIMGETQRDPTADEQRRMEALVETGMIDGAVGFSTGLIYVPGTYSKTPEVIGLAKAAAKHNGVYASHIRDEADLMVDAVEEAINIGRQAGMPVEISHFKTTYKPNWGRAASMLALVEKARKEGIEVTVDQYPYIASSTSLNTRLPTWVFSGGRDSLLARLKDPNTRAKIIKSMHADLKEKLAKDYSYCLVARYTPDSTINGLNISQVNVKWGNKPTADNEMQTILKMVEAGGASMVFFSMDENDLKTIMQYPFNMIASDAGINKLGSGVPHPRGYGTNARVLGRYVREMKIVRLEEAIRRMSSLPAQKFKLNDRGLLKPGMAADIVVFDENTVTDKATFGKPHQYAAGFHYVLVNGKITVDEGKHNGTRAGTVLKGPGAK